MENPAPCTVAARWPPPQTCCGSAGVLRMLLVAVIQKAATGAAQAADGYGIAGSRVLGLWVPLVAPSMLPATTSAQGAGSFCCVASSTAKQRQVIQGSYAALPAVAVGGATLLGLPAAAFGSSTCQALDKQLCTGSCGRLRCRWYG
jgi:hypothetical protein